MNEPRSHSSSFLHQLSTTLAVAGSAHARARASDAFPDHRGELDDLLISSRAELDRAIQACQRREWLDDARAPGDDACLIPRHLTEIDSLKRIRDHLDRLKARLGNLGVPRDNLGEIDPIRLIDEALVISARRLVRRFEVDDARHNLLADVEAELWRFEGFLQERIRLYPESIEASSSQAAAEIRPSGDAVYSPTGPTEEMPSVSADPASRLLDQYRDVLRKVDRQIMAAEGDLPLQLFWRGVKYKYREEAARLGPALDRERILLSIIDV